MKQQSISWPLTIAVLAVWIVIASVGIAHHEIWLDEAQHWLLAKDSKSLGEMFYNMRYEGHPPLWNILLFAVSRVTPSIVGMQMLHLIFAAACVFVVVRYAPFPSWLKMILPFTYFLGYEYAVIARNYAPAVLFLLLAVVCVTKRPRLVPILLGIAVLFHIYAVLLAIPLLIFCYVDMRSSQIPLRPWVISFGLFVLVTLAAVWFVQVPRDHFLLSSKLSPTFTIERLGAIALIPFTSLMHMPKFSGDYWWNGNLFLPDSDMLKAIVAIVFGVATILVFWSNRKILWLCIGGLAFISAGLFFTPMVISTRHAGFLAIFFLICLWLNNGERLTMVSRVICVMILSIQLIACGITYIREIQRPFSQSENVATYLKQNYPGMKVIADPHYVGPPVAAYLEKPIFYPELNKEGSFTNWSNLTFVVDSGSFMLRCQSYMDQNKLDSVVVIRCADNKYYHSVKAGRDVISFTGAAVMAENYTISILKKQ